MCGVGTTLVEAVHQGRDAIGVEYEPPGPTMARANLDLAASQEAPPATARCFCGDARHLASLGRPRRAGPRGLVLTSPPYGPSLHGQVTHRSRAEACASSHDRYSTDPANLAHVGLAGLLAAMGQVFAGRPTAAPRRGFVAMTVRPWWHRGELVDLPGALAAVGEDAGLVLYERNVALLAGLRDDRLVPRASFFALEQVRKARARGVPRLVTAHEDLLALRLASGR